MIELPEGITLNVREEDSLEILIPYEVIEDWKCNKCELELEAVMLGENGRFDGSIRVSGQQSITWQGKLPKNEDKARKYLKDTLSQRISKHKGMH
jgi:hypothetical protein